MSFIYPRVVQITRTNIAHTAQDGLNQTETVVAANVPASIQLAADRSASTRITPGPTNTNDAQPTWKIYIPLTALANGTIQKADKVTDDLGVVYTVEAPYWNSLGYAIEVRNMHP